MTLRAKSVPQAIAVPLSLADVHQLVQDGTTCLYAAFGYISGMDDADFAARDILLGAVLELNQFAQQLAIFQSVGGAN